MRERTKGRVAFIREDTDQKKTKTKTEGKKKTKTKGRKQVEGRGRKRRKKIRKRGKLYVKENEIGP